MLLLLGADISTLNKTKKICSRIGHRRMAKARWRSSSPSIKQLQIFRNKLDHNDDKDEIEATRHKNA